MAELAVLRAALQAAVTLEFATLPPYLCALWSVKDEVSPVADSIRQIVQEEMLHLALAANMHVSIAGPPRIATAAPVYPGPLPLGVHPELVVHLAGLSQDTLATFLEIERPDHPGHHVALNAARDLVAFHAAEDEADDDGTADVTIGAFYEHILESFPAAVACAVDGPAGHRAARVDGRQGRRRRRARHRHHQARGGGQRRPRRHRRVHLAHYYRFAEIIELKRLVQDPATGDYAFVTPIAFDMQADVWPMAPVPAGGYALAGVDDPEVRRLLAGFDVAYSRLLDLLQAVWESDAGQAALWHGIDAMFEMEKYARPLMQVPRPDGAGNYGPCFRYVPAAQR